jgi:uncharacterized membrane protein YraQ (UPF0718 family)
MSARLAVRGGLGFLFAVLILYSIAYGFDPVSTSHAMSRSAALVSRLVPVLGTVILVLFVSNLLLRGQWVREHLGAHSGPRGWFLAAVGGILAAGPVYAWYALLGDLRAKGMRPGLMSVFLYTRAIKLPLLPLLIHYFGLVYTMIFSGYLILFSLPAGLLLERLVDERAGPPSAGERQSRGSGR